MEQEVKVTAADTARLHVLQVARILVCHIPRHGCMHYPNHMLVSIYPIFNLQRLLQDGVFGLQLARAPVAGEENLEISAVEMEDAVLILLLLALASPGNLKTTPTRKSPSGMFCQVLESNTTQLSYDCAGLSSLESSKLA